jgi:hypothetical protein
VGWTSAAGGGPSDDGQVLISADGEVWEPVADREPFLGHRITAVAARDEVVIATGVRPDGRLAAWRSSNEGSSWEPTLPPDAPPGSSVGAITAFDEGFVAVGEHLGQDPMPGLWFSTDGSAWYAGGSPSENGSLADVTSGPTGLLAVGDRDNRALLLHSSDGRTWEVVDDLDDGGLVTVTALNGCLIAAVGPPHSPALWTSTGADDSWKRLQHFDANAGASVHDIAYGGASLVVVATADGQPTTWTLVLEDELC